MKGKRKEYSMQEAVWANVLQGRLSIVPLWVVGCRHMQGHWQDQPDAEQKLVI